MKKCNFVLLPLLLSSGFISAVRIDPVAYISSSTIPVKEKYAEDFNIDFTFIVMNANPEVGVSVYINAKIYTDSGTKQVKSSKYKLTNLVGGGISYTVPSNDYLSEKGMLLTVKVMFGDTTTVIKSVDVPIQCSQLKSVDPSVDEDQKILSSIYVHRNNIYENYETYHFDYVDYFTNDLYYKLDISQFKFTYKADEPF